MTLALRTGEISAPTVSLSPSPSSAPTHAPHPADTLSLKLAMRHMAGGVCVITAGQGRERTGATVTSATALSVDPPTMIVAINRTSSSYPVIRAHGHFCVNILASDQQPIADRFAGKGGLKGPERYEGAEWTTLESGAPVLRDALAAIDCEVEEVIERHSHAIFIGRVLSIGTKYGAHGAMPLVYANGQYRTFNSDDR
jgi:flavin reductase (DIM6/NTAB) family NADH-FMN oxidoreductase RutF